MVDLQGPTGPEYPRPDGPSLALTELRPADVLFSRGTTDIANAIVANDGASCCSAAAS
jgi:hypothetical protein